MSECRDQLEILEARIEVLSTLNSSYSTLLLALYSKLIEKELLSKKDDAEIAVLSKKFMEDLQQYKLLCGEYRGTC